MACRKKDKKTNNNNKNETNEKVEKIEKQIKKSHLQRILKQNKMMIPAYV